MAFALEAMQAKEGDCLLLHYTPAGGEETLVLIDGGARGVYKPVLKPRLESLRGGAPLRLRMAIVSHIDSDHISGMVDLFRDLRRARDEGADPLCTIRTVWHNAFKKVHGGAPARLQSAVVAASLEGEVVEGLDEFTRMVVASVPQGNELHDLATQMGIPINQEYDGAPIMAPAQGARRIAVAPGLTFTVLAPFKAQLDALADSWAASKAAHPQDPRAQAADYLNNTVPNMSSIVILAEAEEADGRTRRMLLTGDARGDVILEALATAGVSQNGRCHVDLLKVQHHGSSHSTTQDFFARVTADRYVISGNGTHGIPHPDALTWLSRARAGQPYEAYLTNRSGREDLEATLGAFLEREQRDEPTHVYRFREDPAPSLVATV